MDNEYKVSWIDTNPQNSSYKNEYFAKIKTEKKSLSQDLKDKYEHRLLILMDLLIIFLMILFHTAAVFKSNI